MTVTTAKRVKAQHTVPTTKTTAYGREVPRVLREMQKLGPWKLGPRISDRIFKK